MKESAIVDFSFIFAHVTVYPEVKNVLLFLNGRAISPGHVQVKKDGVLECMDYF